MFIIDIHCSDRTGLHGDHVTRHEAVDQRMIDQRDCLHVIEQLHRCHAAVINIAQTTAQQSLRI